MKRLSLLALCTLFLIGCNKEKTTMELITKWQEMRDSNSATVEAIKLEQFIEFVHAKKQLFSISLSDMKGQSILISNWSEYKEGPLTVTLKFEGESKALQWQPRDNNNLAILLRE